MSHKNRLSRAGIVALSLGLAVLSAPAVAQSADRSDYYASIGNPHPELPGFPKISRSDNKIYANVFDPHPEITMPHAGVFATTGGGAPYQPNASQAACRRRQIRCGDQHKTGSVAAAIPGHTTLNPKRGFRRRAVWREAGSRLAARDDVLHISLMTE